MSGELGAKEAPRPSTDERAKGQEDLGLGEREREYLLGWVGENLTLVRRSAFGQRVLYRNLGIAFVIGLAAHVGGFLLKSSDHDGASVPGGRPALCARLANVDRCRRGGVRPDLSRDKKTSVQKGPRCLRGGGGRSSPSRKRPSPGPGGCRGRRPGAIRMTAWNSSSVRVDTSCSGVSGSKRASAVRLRVTGGTEKGQNE